MLKKYSIYAYEKDNQISQDLWEECGKEEVSDETKKKRRNEEWTGGERKGGLPVHYNTAFAEIPGIYYL